MNTSFDSEHARTKVWVITVTCVLTSIILMIVLPKPSPSDMGGAEAASKPTGEPTEAQPIASALSPSVPSDHKPLLGTSGAPQEWGLEMVGLHQAVGGRVLDLRYKVLDTERAALLPEEPGGIYLIDEATGTSTKMPNTPKLGSVPQNPQKLQAGRTYSMSFPNPEQRFKTGSKVTLVIGSMRARNLTVQ